MGNHKSKNIIKNYENELTNKNYENLKLKNYINDLQFLQNNIKISIFFDTLLFDGSDFNCISFSGVLNEMANYNLLKNIKNYIGIGIGSIFAYLLAIGYSIIEINNIILNTNFDNFIIKNIDEIRDFYYLLDNYGYSDGESFYTWIEKLTTSKFANINITFQELYNLLNIKLLLVGTNLTKMKIIYFSHETTPNMKIKDALRIAINIPFIFKPIIWNNEIFVDGSLLDNKLYDKENNNIIYIKLSNNKYINHEILDIKDYIYTIINLLYYKIKEKNSYINLFQTILISNNEILSTDLKISTTEKNKLIALGVTAFQEFMIRRNKTKLLLELKENNKII